MSRKEIAVFINRNAAELAGQAAVQETDDTYKVCPRYARGDQLIGFVVRLKSTCMLPMFEHEPPRYLME